MTTGEHAERFTHLRPLLFTIVYEILGSATESDDVLQDSYLRWADVDLATVRDTKSYLAQLVTSQALNALQAGGCLRIRSHRRRDHEPLCDAQPRQAGGHHDPAGDQPIVTSTTSAAELSHSGCGWCLEVIPAQH